MKKLSAFAMLVSTVLFASMAGCMGATSPEDEADEAADLRVASDDLVDNTHPSTINGGPEASLSKEHCDVEYDSCCATCSEWCLGRPCYEDCAEDYARCLRDADE